MFEAEERVVMAARRFAAASRVGVAPGIRWAAEEELRKAVRAFEKWRKLRPLKKPTRG